MKCRLILTIWSLCGVVLLAQDQPRAANPKSNLSFPEKIQANINALGPIEYISETDRVNFDPYINQVRSLITKNWETLFPDVARAPLLEKGKVDLEFAVMKDGHIAGMKLVGPSGDVKLDRAAWTAVSMSNSLPSLPTEFNRQFIALRSHFYYNAGAVAISPGGNVDVNVGATQHFLVKTKGTRTKNVVWTVTGNGCSGGACGTIVNGIYVAPSVLPTPPVVTVTVTSRDPIAFPSSTVVHLTDEQANPR
jgi:TonB family protein